jgi:hypothetical protein
VSADPDRLGYTPRRHHAAEVASLAAREVSSLAKKVDGRVDQTRLEETYNRRSSASRVVSSAGSRHHMSLWTGLMVGKPSE